MIIVMFWSYAMHISGSVPYLSSFPPFFFPLFFFFFLSLSLPVFQKKKKGILQLRPKKSLFHFYIFQNYNLNHYHKFICCYISADFHGCLWDFNSASLSALPGYSQTFGEQETTHR